MNYKGLKNALFRICYRVNKKNLKVIKGRKQIFIVNKIIIFSILFAK